jgi:hypothetical protein
VVTASAARAKSITLRSGWLVAACTTPAAAPATNPKVPIKRAHTSIFTNVELPSPLPQPQAQSATAQSAGAGATPTAD